MADGGGAETGVDTGGGSGVDTPVDTAVDTAIFDVDGTLVDSNYQHALAWYRAFRPFDITLPLWRLHRGIGMGGDKYVGHVAGDNIERERGDALREAWIEEFDRLIGEIRPFAATAPFAESGETARISPRAGKFGKVQARPPESSTSPLLRC